MNVTEILKTQLEASEFITARIKFKNNVRLKGVKAEILNKNLQELEFRNDYKMHKTTVLLHLTIEFKNKQNELDIHIKTIQLEISFVLFSETDLQIVKAIRIKEPTAALTRK